MSYNHGPMISKRTFDEFILPYYRRVVPHLQKRGIWVFVDTDGDVNRLIDWLVEAGIDGTLPLERQAGTDVALIRQRHPHLRLIGGFDKMTMTRGEAALRAEFERLLPVARQGGFVIACDHQTPPGVSIEQYRLYLRLMQEYAEKAAWG
jgi:uroporphyrinogen-III decarboxylase